MKRIIWGIFFFVGVLNAQNKQILYDFAELPQTLMLNPGAKVENNFFIGFPLISQITVGGGFTAFSAYDIFKNNNVDINVKIKEALEGFDNTEFAQVHQQLEIFSFGFKLNESTYFSGGYYQEFEFLAKLPSDMVDLVYNGNTEVNRKYSAKGIGVRSEMLGVLHAGISKKINDKWQIGGRFKLYSSVFNANSKSNSGNLYTTSGENNTYLQALNDVNISLQTSGVILRDVDEITQSYIAKGLLFGGSVGVGVDVGFTHKIKDQWTINGSLIDLGFVSNKKNVESYQIKGDFETEGFNIIFNDSDDPADYWTNLQDSFNEQIVLDTIYSNYLTFRPLKIYGGVNYGFGKKLDKCRFEIEPAKFLNKLGAQLFSTVGAAHSYISGTLFYERWFSEKFQAKVTYTVDPFSYANFGIGASSQFGPVNLYLLVDNLQYVSNLYAAKSASIQLGVNFIFYNKY